MWVVVMVALVAPMTFGGMDVRTASAAGGSITGWTTLEGNIAGQDGPYMYSNSTVNNDTVTGIFSIRLDASQFSLSSASWNFYTDSWDTSQWTAVSYMYGYRDSSERWPQYQRWYQQVSPANGPSITAHLGFDSYEYNPYASQIDSLTQQIVSLKKYLADNPGASDYQEVNLQVLLLEVQRDLLESHSTQTLSINGDISILPSSVSSSSFSYSEYEENSWRWSDEAGEWVPGESIPVWRADFNIHGHFLAPTLSEAQAMGAQFVPEPATMSLIGLGLAGIIMRRRRNRS